MNKLHLALHVLFVKHDIVMLEEMENMLYILLFPSLTSNNFQ